MDVYEDGEDDNKYEKVRTTRNNRLRQTVILGLLILAATVAFAQFRKETNNQNLEMIRRIPESPDSAYKAVNAVVDPVEQQQQQKGGLQQQQQSQQQRGEEVIPKVDLNPMIARFKELDGKVREYKRSIAGKSNVFMETDSTALKLTNELQDAVRELVVARYGPPPYRVHLVVEFPPSIPDTDQHSGPTGSIVIQMANIEHVPVSVFYYMEIVRTFVGGSFHRNAYHVLQVQMRTNDKFTQQSLPFQEYSDQNPHLQYTTGYAGRPSGPGWYVSIKDNARNHGPGSQQAANPYEADACFGKVVEGVESGVVARIHSVKQDGWLDQANHVHIKEMNILVTDGGDGEDADSFHVWKDTRS